jgi:hypothetical protein
MKTLPHLWQNFTLHPLMHTLLEFTQAEDVENKKAEPKLRCVF